MRAKRIVAAVNAAAATMSNPNVLPGRNPSTSGVPYCSKIDSCSSRGDHLKSDPSNVMTNEASSNAMRMPVTAVERSQPDSR